LQLALGADASVEAGAVTIPCSRVNDDFCDCPDGSDEPGTAACSHLVSCFPMMPFLGLVVSG
jgi:hypothetical protein